MFGFMVTFEIIFFVNSNYLVANETNRFFMMLNKKLKLGPVIFKNTLLFVDFSTLLCFISIQMNNVRM